MLHRVRHVHLRAVDADICKRCIENMTGRPHEWSSATILLITRLLTHEHEPRILRPLTEHRLRRLPT